MKRRDFLKALGIGAGAAVLPFTGMAWAKGEKLPGKGDLAALVNPDEEVFGHFPGLQQLVDGLHPGTVIAGRNANVETFWRDPAQVEASNVAMGHPDHTPVDWWSLTDLNVGQLDHVVIPREAQVGVDFGYSKDFTVYAGPIPVWSFDRPGREMWTPDAELLFPAGLPLRIDPEPKVWTAVIRKPGTPDEFGLVSDNTGGRALRIQNPDVHDPGCWCVTCRAKHDLLMANLGARARRRYLQHRSERPSRWFDLVSYDRKTLDELVRQRTALTIYRNTSSKENPA